MRFAFGLSVALVLPARGVVFAGRGAPPPRDAAAKYVTDAVEADYSELSNTNVVQDLWKGYDDSLFSFSNLARQVAGAEVAKPEATVQVLGLQNSGVSLLKAMLYINFGYRLGYLTQGSDETNNFPGLWEYTNIQDQNASEPGKLQHFYDGTNGNTLIITRSPLSWLKAMRSNPPTEFESCATSPDWMSKACIHPHPAGPMAAVSEKLYKSLPKVWNQWHEGYRSLDADHRLVIQYENLVRNPDNVMKRVAGFLNIEEPMWEMHPDLDDHAGRALAFKNLLENLDPLDHDQKNRACEELNHDALRYYDYYSDCHASEGHQ